jgi:NADH-quinone oxidoreductase subunit H
MIEFGPSDPSLIIQCADSTGCMVIHSIVSSAIFFFVILTGFAYTTVLERRFISWIQDRIGPNRVGPKGLLQPAADGIKLAFKQDVTPLNADRVVYWMAPLMKLIPALIVLGVVPLGPPIIVPWFDGEWYRINQGLIDVNVGILWVLAITSISVYGVTMAGWASANKYSMIGAMRSAASMISYELSLGASFVVPAMIAGSLSFGDIVEAQSGNFIFNWFIFQNPLAAAIMFIALLAEVNRAPFDLPEAEQELVAGHMTEYSGMKFAMFMMGEYISMIAISIIFSSMFLGGYHFILTDVAPILGPIWLTLKVVVLLGFMVWIRATLPRLRYDRLMALGWKVMLPFSLLAIAWTGVVIVLSEEYGSANLYTAASLVLLLVLAAAAMIFGRQGSPLDLSAGKEEIPVVSVGASGPGFIALQFVGSLIAIPFLLFQYQVDILKNLRDAVTSESAEEESEVT